MSKIGDYMSKTIYSTSPDTLAYKAINKMYEKKMGRCWLRIMETM